MAGNPQAEAIVAYDILDHQQLFINDIISIERNHNSNR